MQPKVRDINILNNYQFENSNSSDSWKKYRYNRKHNKFILGVRDGHLVPVQAKDVTIWQLFLRIFGKGKLAHTHVSLKRVCNHLDEYNWKQFNDEQNANFEAYKKVCTIAHRLYFYSNKYPGRDEVRVPQILEHNSFLIRTKHGDFYLNPATTAKDVQRMAWIHLDRWRLSLISIKLVKTDEERRITTVDPHTPLRNKQDIENEDFEIETKYQSDIGRW